MKSVEKIAKRIAASEGSDSLGDYYAFYKDSDWVITVVRRAKDVLAEMEASMESYSTSIPKLEELEKYVDETEIAELNTESCAQEFKSKVDEMKEKYGAWEKADESQKANMSEEYRNTVTQLKDYLAAFEQSAKNAFRNRYIEDERNVKNLLDIIHEKGNSVLNGRSQSK